MITDKAGNVICNSTVLGSVTDPRMQIVCVEANCEFGKFKYVNGEEVFTLSQKLLNASHWKVLR